MINIIARGFVGGDTTKSARKKHLQEVLSLFAVKMKKVHEPSPTPNIVFSSFDFKGIVPGHDDPVVISVVMV